MKTERLSPSQIMTLTSAAIMGVDILDGSKSYGFYSRPGSDGSPLLWAEF